MSSEGRRNLGLSLGHDNPLGIRVLKVGSPTVTPMALHDFHRSLNAGFGMVNGAEVVEHYGDPLAEHGFVRTGAGVFDLGCRSRLCVTGVDRQRFLNGQVTNNVKDLAPGRGCYAALVTAKGRLESDLNIHCLEDELLLDFEPGLAAKVQQRLERFLVADDVQIVDVSASHGLLSVLGPRAGEVVGQLQLLPGIPGEPLTSVTALVAGQGEMVLVNHARGAAAGFDLFAPAPALPGLAARLVELARGLGGGPAGWQALEMIRVEAGLPRFGRDMDESNLAPEAGIDARAISPGKGCYVGQEIINRLRTFAHVNRLLCGLRLEDGLARLPLPGDKLLAGDREAGHLTSALASPAFGRNIALGYVRREFSAPATELVLRSAAGDSRAIVVPRPFTRESL